MESIHQPHNVSDTQETSTVDLTRQLKELRHKVETTAKERHEFNNAMQSLLLTFTTNQQEEDKTGIDLMKIVVEMGRSINRLNNTIFGPNFDNGLRGDIKSANLTIKTLSDKLDLKFSEIEKNQKTENEKVNAKVDKVWLYVIAIASAVQGAGITIQSIFFK